MLREARPRPKRSSPVGALLLIVLFLIAAGVNHRDHIHTTHTKHVRATPVQMTQAATVSLPAKLPPALPFPIGEPSGVLWNLNTHRLLWQESPHMVVPYASTTKLMTIYLALKSLKLSQVVTISPLAAGTTGSDINMAPRQRYDVRQLLYALMLRSANDAAVELAQTTGGSVPAFVQRMNGTAKSLGMVGTHYGDPDGLSKTSYGTAWDLSIIAERDMTNPLFRQIVDTRHMSLPHNAHMQNLNGLLFMDPTVIGLKTGWTTAAGFNLVFAATRTIHGHQVTLMGVIMHGEKGFPPEYQDAEKILNWGFKQAASSTP